MTRFDTYAEALCLRERALGAAVEIAIGLRSIQAGRLALGWWLRYIMEDEFNSRCNVDQLIDDCRRLRGRFERRFQIATKNYVDTLNRLQ